MKRSVFDVSADIFRLSGEDRIPAISLQKIAYYAFGWYGRLTGQELFEQSFYAMEHGPVIGELLTLHSQKHQVSSSLIQAGREAIEDGEHEKDLYYEEILAAVWSYYSQFDRWKLVGLTHEDIVWKDAWEARPEGSKRADIDGKSIVSFFSTRTDMPEDLARNLPDPVVVRLSSREMRSLEALSEVAFAPAVEKFKQLLSA